MNETFAVGNVYVNGARPDAHNHAALWHATGVPGVSAGLNGNGWCAYDHRDGRWAGYCETKNAAVRLLTGETNAALPQL